MQAAKAAQEQKALELQKQAEEVAQGLLEQEKAAMQASRSSLKGLEAISASISA